MLSSSAKRSPRTGTTGTRKTTVATASTRLPRPTLPLATTGAPIDAASLLFDVDWYLAEYPDVAGAGVDPVRHFFDNGAREGRNPNPHFDTSAYVARYEDVAASRMNPFLHYLLYGAREGRTPGA